MKWRTVIRLGLFLALSFPGARVQGEEPLWTWVRGENNFFFWPFFLGTYGTQGVPDPANTPGARQVAATWTGKDGKLWLFGGYKYNEYTSSYGLPTVVSYKYNDLWRFDPATGNWTWVKGSDKPDQDGVYGTQGVAGAANTPGARCASKTWTGADGRLWLFGGVFTSINISTGTHTRVDDKFNDLWCFDPATGNWTWVKGSDRFNRPAIYGTRGVAAPANTPGAGVGAAWTGKDGRLWLLGNDKTNVLWCFNPASGNWTWVKGNNQVNQKGVYGAQGVADPANTPGSRSGVVSWTDRWGGLWLFGGNGNGESQSGMLNDLWRYDPASGNWTWVKGSKEPGATAFYGALGREAPENTPDGFGETWTDRWGRFWLMRGRSLWRFDPLTRNWACFKDPPLPNRSVYGTRGKAAPANTPSSEDAATWSGADGRLWYFGGYGKDVNGFGPSVLIDLWMLTIPPNAVESAAWRGLE